MRIAFRVVVVVFRAPRSSALKNRVIVINELNFCRDFNIEYERVGVKRFLENVDVNVILYLS